MHQYATDSEEKKLIILLLALFSVFATWLLYQLITLISTATGLTAPWWLEIPSIITFYGLSYGIFDKRLWKKSAFRKLGLVRIPDMNGVWKGYLKSSHDQFKEEIGASIKIRQSWTQIEICQETKTSQGHSFVATILTKDFDAMRARSTIVKTFVFPSLEVCWRIDNFAFRPFLQFRCAIWASCYAQATANTLLTIHN